jgi:hypothetical protein
LLWEGVWESVRECESVCECVRTLPLTHPAITLLVEVVALVVVHSAILWELEGCAETT